MTSQLPGYFLKVQNRADTVGNDRATAISRIDPALFASPLIYHRAGQASSGKSDCHLNGYFNGTQTR
jgi:hypothetical protein